MSADVVLLGDLNGDGAVDGSDVSILLEQVLGGSVSSDADLNDDGSVDGGDVSILLEAVLGGEPIVKYEVETLKVNDVEFTMVKVKGGTFTMGGTAEQGSDVLNSELPTHSVTLSTYWIGQTEVTQELWSAVMGVNPSGHTGENLPVDKVSWDDCQEFIAKLNELTGMTFRLPTEAEWEYAARGGHSGGTKYSGSDDINAVAWYSSNSSNTTHPVATKQPNGLGLYDMSGNILEWCADWYYGGYSAEAQTNPTGPETGSRRSLRGGSYAREAVYCRVSERDAWVPTYRFADVGMRLVR